VRRLRLQLIAILILVALLPAIPAGWAAHQLFRQVLDPLMTDDILEGARAGLASTRDILEREKEIFALSILEGTPLDTLRSDDPVLSDRERTNLASRATTAPGVDPAGGYPQILIPPDRMPLGGQESLVARVAGTDGTSVWVLRPLPEGLSARAEQLTSTVRFVQSIRHERSKVTRGFVATFLVVYGVILLCILGLGLFLASRLTRPVAALGRGIQEVASGDLEAQVPRVAGGEIGRLLTSFNEMVDRLRRQQSELLRLEKVGAWRQMARSLAHEIKNPLTPIQLAAQQMRDAYPGDDAEYRELLTEGTEIIEEEVSGLRNMVTEFSQFARMPEPQMGEVHLQDLLSDLRSLYGPDQLEVTDPTADGPPIVWCDRDQIHRVLINLINNGLQALSAIGRRDPITLSVSATHGDGDGPTVVLQVADRGPGVPEAERRRIFEPDYTTKSDGMGLGLAIVEATIRGHGGAISVSDRPDGGAIFSVTLPTGPPTTETPEPTRGASS
jgi:nitrogen fixation/metabolism regulation signal transduction histidine kinase